MRRSEQRSIRRSSTSRDRGLPDRLLRGV